MKNSMLLPVSLQDIQYFLAIVQFNTLNKAADYLNVTQPLLSKRMRFLQDTIGITLFKHSNRNIVLTPSGKLLYKEWGQIIQSNVAQSLCLIFSNLASETKPEES